MFTCFARMVAAAAAVLSWHQLKQSVRLQDLFGKMIEEQ